MSKAFERIGAGNMDGSDKRCMNCGAEVTNLTGYCGFDCTVEHHKKLHPNKSDHPDRKAIVTVRLVGTTMYDERLPNEAHELLYTDGYVALTTYECCYSLWSMKTGKLIAGSLYGAFNAEGDWRIDERSLERIKRKEISK